jgi:nicotinate-nucleotide adenylyltransferase
MPAAKTKDRAKPRFGILGGTFDPVHFGHLTIAEKMRARFNLEGIYFIPNFQSPHKARTPVADSYDRYAMLALATQHNHLFKVLPIELRKQTLSYTIETIKELTRRGKKENLFFILGADSFEEFTAWKDYQDLLRRCHFIVVNREGAAFSEIGRTLPAHVRRKVVNLEEEASPDPADLERKMGGRRKYIFYVHIHPVPFSSSDIRRRMKKEESVRYQVPDAVLGYIQKNELYL